MTNSGKRSTLESRLPARTDADLDAAVEQLVESIQVGFDRRLVLRLERASRIDIARVETELRLLDLFAVFVAIKMTDCESWRDVGAAVFERVCIRLLAWWAPAWDTKDDVVEVLNGRFAAYNRLAEASGPADINGMSLLVGLLCAAIIQGDRRLFADGTEPRGEAFGYVVADLMEQDNLVCTTATTVFRTRFDTVSELFLMLDR